MTLEELGERVVAAIVNENSGNAYRRINTIRARAIDDVIELRLHAYEGKKER